MKIRVLRSISVSVISRIRYPKFLIYFCAILFALSFTAEAQQSKKIPRLGWLSTGSPSVARPNQEAFHRGLRDLGYIEGQNITIEYRYAEGLDERLPNLAAELVQLKVDVIVATGTSGVQATMT